MENSDCENYNVKLSNGTVLFNFFYSFIVKSNSKSKHFNHFHVNTEIIVIEKGEGYIYTPQKELYVKAGDVIIMRSMEPHLFSSSKAENPMKAITLSFSPRNIITIAEEFINPIIIKIFSPENDINTLLEGKDEKTKVIFDSVVKIKESLISENKNTYFAKTTFIFVIMLLTDMLKISVPRGSVEKHKYIEMILEAVSYINKHLTSELTLKDIAHNSNMEVSHFSKIFKELQGLSPWKYVIYSRIELAMGYLNDSVKNYQILEVAHLCGFNNLSNFNKIFKNVIGMTPNEFKKWNKLNKFSIYNNQ